MVALRHGIEIDMDALSEVCKRYQVRELSLFGSVLRDDFRQDSDVDLLVEFDEDATIGLFDYSDLRYELVQLFDRNVDLVSKRGLRSMFREDVLATARPVYAR